MKSIIAIAAAAILLFASCGRVIEPRADFTVSNSQVETFQDIEFFNTSNHATSYEWDFGDGYITNTINPIHHYSKTGVYTVRLSAFNHDMVDYSYLTITVYDPTFLSIEVLEYFDEYPVTGASIKIYPSLTDWLNQTNEVAEIYSDRNGIAEIEGLAPGYYYLDIWEKNHDNYALQKEPDGVKYIRTPYLDFGTIVYFTAYVDYVQQSMKKSASARRSEPISIIENRIQKEVKFSIQKK